MVPLPEIKKKKALILLAAWGMAQWISRLGPQLTKATMVMVGPISDCSRLMQVLPIVTGIFPTQTYRHHYYFDSHYVVSFFLSFFFFFSPSTLEHS